MHQIFLLCTSGPHPLVLRAQCHRASFLPSESRQSVNIWPCAMVRSLKSGNANKLLKVRQRNEVTKIGEKRRRVMFSGEKKVLY